MAWYVDNSSGLFALTKGVSGNSFLEHTSQLLHLYCFVDQSDIWFEYVPTDENWSDGISRDLDKNSFILKHSISAAEIGVQKEWWSQSLASLLGKKA